MTVFIWPFLLSIGKVLLPNLIRTAVPVIANTLISRVAGPPQSPQQAATYDEEEEEFEDEEEFEEEEFE